MLWKRRKRAGAGGFDLSDDIEEIMLKGVVSRKKQLIPAFVISLQQ